MPEKKVKPKVDPKVKQKAKVEPKVKEKAKVEPKVKQKAKIESKSKQKKGIVKVILEKNENINENKYTFKLKNLLNKIKNNNNFVQNGLRLGWKK